MKRVGEEVQILEVLPGHPWLWAVDSVRGEGRCSCWGSVYASPSRSASRRCFFRCARLRRLTIGNYFQTGKRGLGTIVPNHVQPASASQNFRHLRLNPQLMPSMVKDAGEFLKSSAVWGEVFQTMLDVLVTLPTESERTIFILSYPSVRPASEFCAVGSPLTSFQIYLLHASSRASVLPCSLATVSAATRHNFLFNVVSRQPQC